MKPLLIGGLQKTTLIDYPGKVACTVFLIGCNFRCPFCYSSELVLPEKIKKQARISSEEFFSFLEGKRGLLDGVVICGGEPTINPDLPDFIRKIKKLGYLVKLDTNGSNPDMLAKLIKESLIDYIAMDIKTSLTRKKYNEVIGINMDLSKIKKSIKIIQKSGVKYEFRSTILPKLHSLQSISSMARTLRGSNIVYLQQFRPEKTLDPSYLKIKPFDQVELKIIQEECNKHVLTKLRN